MQKFFSKITELEVKTYLGSIQFGRKIKNKFLNEDGDTNFISIIVVLAIVLVLAGVFIAFKDTILTEVKKIYDKFATQLSGQKNSDFISST